MTNTELLEQMESALESGGEAALERYLIDNFENLPKDIQGKVLVSFMRETVEGDDAILEIQEKGIAAIQAIEALKAEITNEGSK